MARPRDYANNPVVGLIVVLQLSSCPCFTYSAAHGNSNSFRLVVRLHTVAVFLAISLFRADRASHLLAGTGYEFAISNESCGRRKCKRPGRTNRMGVLGSGRA